MTDEKTEMMRRAALHFTESTIQDVDGRMMFFEKPYGEVAAEFALIENARILAQLADATATLHKQSGMANEINILTKENRQLRDRLADAREQIDQFNADKVALEELFVIDGRFAPDYESGWNDAIAKAIEKFGRNALFQENEELLGKLAEAREQIAAYEAVLQKIANEDYRGNRSPASQLAYDALKAGKQDVPQSKMAGPSQGINETRVTHECEVSVTE